MSNNKVELEREILILISKNDTLILGFNSIVALYQEDVYWQIRRMVGRHEDAADLSQEVWLQVFKNLKNFKKESTLYTWIYRIALNTSLNFLKKSKTAKNKMRDLPQVSDTMHGQLLESEEIWQLLQEGVAILPEKQQLVFNLRYFEEKKYKDISQLSGTSVGALKASYHLAVKKIEAYVKERL